MIYKKIKPISTHGYTYIDGFKKVFPELMVVTPEKVSDRFKELGVTFYESKTIKVPPLLRLTLPFAIITLLVMIIGLPLNFMLTGQWGYSPSKSNKIYNWFKSLNLQ